MTHMLGRAAVSLALTLTCVCSLQAQDDVAAYAAKFVEAPCDVPNAPPRALGRLRCGTVAVPVLPGDLSAGVYELFVMVVRSAKQPARPDALVALAGGPGGSLITPIVFASMNPRTDRAAERDVVVIDPRAAGRSDPQVCVGYAAEVVKLLPPDLSTDELIARRIKVREECLDEARAEGIVPESLGTIVNADDVERVRQALGYGPWNAMGTSYGAATGLTLAARHPESLRALVLDSVALGASSPLYARERWQAAMLGVLADCAADAICAHDYPDLAAALERALELLEANPLNVPAPEGFDTPDGVIVMNRGDFEALLYGQLYTRQQIAEIPALIRDVIDARPDAFVPIYRELLSSRESSSLFGEIATYCRDMPQGAPRMSVEPDRPLGGYEIQTTGDICTRWVEPDPAAVIPENTSVPTLVLAGRLDPATPVAFSRIAAERLGPSARFVLIPAVGHAVAPQSPCGLHIVTHFLDDPSAPLDASCVADAPPISFARPHQ
jgi:pimeloyl-ACP methyl ester carboxylesterase